MVIVQRLLERELVLSTVLLVKQPASVSCLCSNYSLHSRPRRVYIIRPRLHVVLCQLECEA